MPDADRIWGLRIRVQDLGFRDYSDLGIRDRS